MIENNPLTAAEEEIKRLHTQRESTAALLASIDEKISAVQKVVELLSPIYPVDDDSLALFGNLGITDAVRSVFKDNRNYLVPTDVRDALEAKGLIKGYDNEMAVIHQVIRRLQDQAQIEVHPTEKMYRWLERSPVKPKFEPISRVRGGRR